MRLSRGCYDKFHRCPGWAGSGLKYPKGDDRCKGGHIRTWAGDDMLPLWRWRFLPCDTCDVVVWPYVTKWVDPTWILDRLRTRGPLQEMLGRKGLLTHHAPQWVPADLPVDAIGTTRPGFECAHELENGNGRCGGNVFDPTDEVDDHCCFIATPSRWTRAVQVALGKVKP